MKTDKKRKLNHNSKAKGFTDERKTWDNYWKKASEKKSFFGTLFTIYRKQVFARALRHYTETYFPKKGIFLECGSGSSQASIRLKQHKRVFIAVDISEEALNEAKKIPQIKKTVRADIRKLPFKAESIDGIWNLGVMEHFSEKDICLILREFKRVLKKDGTLIIFWVPAYSLISIFLRTLKKLQHLFRKKPRFFPDEPSALHSKKEARKHMQKAGFDSKEYFNFRDAYSHIVVVAKKARF